MKRKMIICGALSLTLLSSSCLGSFKAFNNLRDWNDGLTSNKFVDNLVFWALNIVPVYGLFFFADAVIFNLIEFWTGSNPIAMAEGEKETQYAEVDGNKVRMTAEKNKFTIEKLNGEQAGEKVVMIYTPDNQTWNLLGENGELQELASFDDGFYVLHLPTGDEVRLDANASLEQNQQIFNSEMNNYEHLMYAKNE